MIRISPSAGPSACLPFIHGPKRRASPRTFVIAAACVCASLPADFADAHGFAGKRFFPATLATDDPFVADELSLPTVTSRRTGEDPSTTETDLSVDFTKRITTDFGLGFGATYLRLRPEGGPTQNGFDNFSANAKYQFYKSDEHETILSVGADWDIGGSGSKRLGVDSFSTVSPTLFFGKGFGDLPDAVQYLRPFALTGSAGIGLPTRARSITADDSGALTTEQHPNVLQLGLALEYSLPYLQSFVKDIGLREPFNRIVLVVELALEKPLDRGRGLTVGTVNPGVLIAGRYIQLGIEAVIPVNGKTGGRTGALVQLHFFLDDFFPTTFGKPLFDR
ncbi:MAG: hypothetical protein ABI330_08660 [Caldimonas sp.]